MNFSESPYAKKERKKAHAKFEFSVSASLVLATISESPLFHFPLIFNSIFRKEPSSIIICKTWIPEIWEGNYPLKTDRAVSNSRCSIHPDIREIRQLKFLWKIRGLFTFSEIPTLRLNDPIFVGKVDVLGPDAKRQERQYSAQHSSISLCPCKSVRLVC